jgi:putative flavoprotein involved in K+ transport
LNASRGTERPFAIVIGAGPAGLATAASLAQQCVNARLVDRNGTVGGAFQRICPDTELLSMARHHGLPGLKFSPGSRYASAGQYREYLKQYAAHHGLVADRASVERIERSGGGFRVHFTNGGEIADYGAVVVATGMYDHPVWPEIPGLPRSTTSHHDSLQVLHAQSWQGPQTLGSRRLLIIGGGTSAVEIAEQCARERIRVVVASRHRIRLIPKDLFGFDVHGLAYPLTSRLDPWFLRRYCARQLSLPGVDRGFRRFHRERLIRIRGPVRRFEGSVAVFGDGGREPFDSVVLATGYQFTTSFLPADVAPQSANRRFARDAESRVWPGLHFVGIRCARTLSSEFLRGIARDSFVVASHIRARRDRSVRAARATGLPGV